MGEDPGIRIDDLAQRAGIATTTVRLYQQRGLLAPPRLVGRTGYYDDGHLARLRLIARLQDEGHSLAGIGQVLASWEQGRDLAALVGVEEQLDALLHHRHELVLAPHELAYHFPVEVLTPDLVQQAVALGLVVPTDDGRLRIPDRRFLDVGAALARLGIHGAEILAEWTHLLALTDDVAGRFIALFEQHVLPAGAPEDIDAAQAGELAATLAQLHQLAGQVLAAALDASIARLGAQRFAALLGEGDGGRAGDQRGHQP